jgi:hypothetical protein
MRMNLVYAIGFAITALPALTAVAMAAAPMPATQASSTQVTPVQQCPAGTYWEPSGYVGSGKWRNAHCATTNGHE